MNKQREAIYGWRRQMLEKEDQKARILDIVRGIIGEFMNVRTPPKSHPSTWDLTGLETDVQSQFGVRIRLHEFAQLSRSEIEDRIYDQLAERYQEKEDLIGAEAMRETERMIMLHVIDQQWKDHLLSMDHLKEGIGLRGYGQKDPLVEYKKESYVLFEELMDRIENEALRYLFFLQVSEGEPPALPFSDDDDEEDEDSDGDAPQEQPEAVAAQRAAAQANIEDFTRNIQRKKEREMAALQFAGSDTSVSKTVVKRGQGRPERPMPLRKWQKIQEMLRIILARFSAALPLFALAAATALPSRAGIWTDALAGYTRTSAVAPPITDKPLWDEYGFEQAERAQYESAKGKFTGTAWRVKDSTAALAVFDGMVPADAKPTKVTELSVEDGPTARCSAFGTTSCCLRVLSPSRTRSTCS